MAILGKGRCSVTSEKVSLLLLSSQIPGRHKYIPIMPHLTTARAFRKVTRCAKHWTRARQTEWRREPENLLHESFGEINFPVSHVPKPSLNIRKENICERLYILDFQVLLILQQFIRPRMDIVDAEGRRQQVSAIKSKSGQNFCDDTALRSSGHFLYAGT